jgi:hypothetical protein
MGLSFFVGVVAVHGVGKTVIAYQGLTPSFAANF